MPHLDLQGLYPKIGKPFSAMLDDGHSRIGLPVAAELGRPVVWAAAI